VHFRHRQTDRQTDTDIVAYKREMYILHLARKTLHRHNVVIYRSDAGVPARTVAPRRRRHQQRRRFTVGPKVKVKVKANETVLQHSRVDGRRSSQPSSSQVRRSASSLDRLSCTRHVVTSQ